MKMLDFKGWTVFWRAGATAAIAAVSGLIAVSVYQRFLDIWNLPPIVSSHTQNIKDLQER